MWRNNVYFYILYYKMARTPNPYINTNPPSGSLSFLQNYRIPYLLCPVCGQPSLQLSDLNSPPGSFTCLSNHIFYKCPTCLDTRVSDRRENIFYCGLLHPYHFCVVHKRPVVGVGQLSTKCTCGNNPQNVTRQRIDTHWESPFV